MSHTATEANYAADVRRAYDAAREWVAAHAGLAVTFLDWGSAGLLCSLSEIADEWCAGDKDSRELLQVMIDATEDRCTYLQAKFVLRHVLHELGSPGRRVVKRSTLLLWIAVHFATIALSTQLLAYSLDRNIYDAARACWLMCIGAGVSTGWLLRGFHDWRKSEQLRREGERIAAARAAFELRYQQWVDEIEHSNTALERVLLVGKQYKQ